MKRDHFLASEPENSSGTGGAIFVRSQHWRFTSRATTASLSGGRAADFAQACSPGCQAGHSE